MDGLAMLSDSINLAVLEQIYSDGGRRKPAVSVDGPL